MSEAQHPIVELLRKDSRYQLEAYRFVRDALSYAQDELQLGGRGEEPIDLDDPPPEAHLTGQQLCEAIRLYALQQYGLMAKMVLHSWGVYTTADFGEIVYNLIDIGFMKKSDADRREDFHDVYDFSEAFEQQFEITLPE